MKKLFLFKPLRLVVCLLLCLVGGVGNAWGSETVTSLSNGDYISMAYNTSGESSKSSYIYFYGASSRPNSLAKEQIYKVVIDNGNTYLQNVSTGKYIGTKGSTVKSGGSASTSDEGYYAITEVESQSSAQALTVESTGNYLRLYFATGTTTSDTRYYINAGWTASSANQPTVYKKGTYNSSDKKWGSIGEYSQWTTTKYTDTELINLGCSYTVSLSQPTGGSLKFSDNTTADKTLVYGTSVTVSQEATSGYTFSNWTVGGSSVSTSSSDYTYDCSTQKPTVGSTVTISATYTTSLVSGKAYYIENNSYNKYWNSNQTASGNASKDKGSNLSIKAVSSGGTPFILTGSGTSWTIQTTDGTYIAAYKWDVYKAGTGDTNKFTWTITSATGGYTIYQNASTDFAGYAGLDSSSDELLYSNKSSQVNTFIPLVKVTYNYQDASGTSIGTSSSTYLKEGESYPSYSVPSNYYYVSGAPTESTVSATEAAKTEVTYTIVCAYALPKTGQIFQLRANGQYFSNTADNTFSGNGTGASTYFHYDGTHLTSMQTGKQVSNSGTTLTNAVIGSGSTVSFSQCSGSKFLIGIGTYNIQNGNTPVLNTPGTSVGPGYQFEMLNSSTYTPYAVTITTPTGYSGDARYLTPTKEGFTTCTLYNSSIYAAGADETVSESSFSTTSDGIAITGYAPSIAVDTDAKTITVTYEKHETVESLKQEINANSNYTQSVAAYNNCDGTLTKDYPGYKPYAVTKALYDAMQNTSVELATLKTANENFCAAAIVLPSAGNFYRMKNVSSSKYISSATATHSSNNMTLLAMVDKTGNEDATIFGLNSNGYLYSYDKGYFVTGKLKTSNSTDYQATNATTSSIKMPFDIQRNGDTRNFTIVFHADRCLYGAGTTVDAGAVKTDGTRLTDAGYLWVLEPVQFDGYEVFIDNSASASMSVTGTYGGYSTLTDGSLYASAVGTVPTSSDFTVNAGTGYSATTPSISSGSTKKIEVKCTNTTHSAMFTLFNSNRATYPFRIPAITETKDGKLLAVGDYRYSGNDVGISTSNGGRIDIIGRTSSDNGANWSEPYTVAQGEGVLGQSATQKEYAGYGDAAMVTDASGKILVMTCYGTGAQKWNSGNQGTCRWISEDNGETFTRTTTFDGSTKYSNWGFYGFFTSGRIFQSKYIKKSGSDYYRVYAAACGTTTTGNNTSSTFVLYSDDLGETWKVLGGKGTAAVPNGGNEAKVEELPDGRVIVSSRHTNGRYFNIYTYTNSENATGSWANTTGTQSSVGSGDGTGTNGEIMILPAKQGDKDVYVALNTAPAGGTVDGSTVARSHVSVYYKVLSGYDDIKNVSAIATGWTLSKELSSIKSAYSSMVLQSDGKIGIVWEENRQDKTSNVESYDIKYEPFTLADLTENNCTLNNSVDRQAFLTTYFTALKDDQTDWTDARKAKFAQLVDAISETPTVAQMDAIYSFIASPYDYTVTIATADETKGTVKFSNDDTGATSKNLTSGTSVTVVATVASDSYEFVNWTNAVGGVMSSDEEYTFNAAGDIDLTANFKQTVSNSVVIGTSTGNFINNDGETATGDHSAIKWESTTVNGLVLESDVTDDHMSFYNLNSGSFYFKTPVSADGSAYGTRNYYLKSSNRKIIGYEIKVECHKIGFTLTDNTFNQSVSASSWDSSEKTMSKSDISVDEIDFNLVVNHTTAEYLWVNSFTVYLEESEAGTEIPVTIGSTGYASLYYGNVDLTVPESGVTAYTYVYNDGKLSTKGYGAGSVIPAGVGVILKGEAGSYTFTASTPATETNVKPDGLRMFGTDVAETTPSVNGGDKFYMLSRKDGVLGLYYGVTDGGAFTNAAHKAYLNLSSSEADARTYIPFDFDTPTAIENIASGVDENATIYNIAGQRVANMKNGLYIVNGKKVIK